MMFGLKIQDPQFVSVSEKVVLKVSAALTQKIIPTNAPLFLTSSTYLPDMSNTTFFTPIPIPNIFKEALTIPNTNTNFMMSP